MAADERKIGTGKHTIVMNSREHISATGVIDVLSFDEEGIVADTEMGLLVIKGENLHVNKLNLDVGELNIDGAIDVLEYQDPNSFGKGKGSFLSKIFK